MLPLSDATKEYLLKNEWEPTIQNIYLAAHSGVSTKGNQQIDFAALEKQMEQIIKAAGLTVSEESKENCQWLIQKNIGLTVSNPIGCPIVLFNSSLPVCAVPTSLANNSVQKGLY